MNEASIMMDFRKAQQQADRIEDIASRLSNISNVNYDNTMKMLSNNWKGDSASTYLNKCLALQESLNDTVSNYRSTAESIRNTARRIYEAEMKNLEIAQKRKAEENSKENNSNRK